MTVTALVLTLFAVALLAPLAVLAVECVAALLPARSSADGPRPTVARSWTKALGHLDDPGRVAVPGQIARDPAGHDGADVEF